MAGPPGATLSLAGDGLEAVINAVREKGYTVIAPTVRDGAIAYEPVTSVTQLPRGIGDEQAPARYRLRDRDDDALFGFAAAPSSWKRYLYPPATTLWRVRRDEQGSLAFEETAAPVPRYAFLGVRACELAAILVHDRVFAGSTHPDPTYAARRRELFIIAVHCGSPSGVCFCTSMNTGPRAREGFDLAITELLDAGAPRYVIEAGSPAGQELLDTLDAEPATKADLDAARAVTDVAAERMGRQMDTRDLPQMLQRNLEHPRWDDVAARCLSCGNCTMACPTCFCSDDVESQAPDGATSSRVREWASCFSRDFSYIHGGTVRQTVRSRYRQWMTHKLGTWWDQFDSSGCVGCGRCIAWCPVGIDITEEAAAIRSADGLRGGSA
ncbi:MAG TPA: 4Fe-4S dicluster domain-containing protein [Candidatus Saccharimonadales bacterium]|nr:4Fe-4S dicluster domain-containing protein [Candidatus Saccharimonadales bacterium]